MNTLPIILDGSKFDWFSGPDGSGGLGFVADLRGFPQGGRPPVQVGVRSHRTGWTVVFSFVDMADDGEGNVALNYQGTLPDGRRCTLTVAG